MAIQIIPVTDRGGAVMAAHKFYFRVGMFVVSFNFRKDMSR